MTLFLLVARGGSKGLPRKNLAVIADHTLIAWKVAGVRAFQPDVEIVCSTDADEIADEAQYCDCKVIMRPAELATDTATTDSVIAHALEHYPDHSECFLLEPSSPFTAPQHYWDALGMFRSKGAALVAGTRETYPNTAFIQTMPSDGRIDGFCLTANAMADSRRQVLAREWTVSGSLYLFSTAAFRETGRIYGTPMRSYGMLQDVYYSTEIENAEDLEMARAVVASGHVQWPG